MVYTFYDETVRAIVDSGHAVTEVTFVGSSDGKCGMDFIHFTSVSQFVYDAGYGTAEIPQDLIIQFSDSSYLERREYDGSEWWQYVAVKPKYNVTNSAAVTLKRDPDSHFGEYVLSLI